MIDYLVLYVFGNRIYWIPERKEFRLLENDKLYKKFDNNFEVIYEENLKLWCPKCGMSKYTKEDGIDPCLGKLPGVDDACCGHGVDKGYIKFMNGTIIRGYFDIER